MSGVGFGVWSQLYLRVLYNGKCAGSHSGSLQLVDSHTYALATWHALFLHGKFVGTFHRLRVSFDTRSGAL